MVGLQEPVERMRPARAEYSNQAYSDGWDHITLTLNSQVHKQLIERIQLENRQNRTEWIREAIAEKLAKPARLPPEAHG